MPILIRQPFPRQTYGPKNETLGSENQLGQALGDPPGRVREMDPHVLSHNIALFDNLNSSRLNQSLDFPNEQHPSDRPKSHMDSESSLHYDEHLVEPDVQLATSDAQLSDELIYQLGELYANQGIVPYCWSNECAHFHMENNEQLRPMQNSPMSSERTNLHQQSNEETSFSTANKGQQLQTSAKASPKSESHSVCLQINERNLTRPNSNHQSSSQNDHAGRVTTDYIGYNRPKSCVASSTRSIHARVDPSLERDPLNGNHLYEREPSLSDVEENLQMEFFSPSNESYDGRQIDQDSLIPVQISEHSLPPSITRYQRLSSTLASSRGGKIAMHQLTASRKNEGILKPLKSAGTAEADGSSFQTSYQGRPSSFVNLDEDMRLISGCNSEFDSTDMERNRQLLHFADRCDSIEDQFPDKYYQWILDRQHENLFEQPIESRFLCEMGNQSLFPQHNLNQHHRPDFYSPTKIESLSEPGFSFAGNLGISSNETSNLIHKSREISLRHPNRIARFLSADYEAYVPPVAIRTTVIASTNRGIKRKARNGSRRARRGPQELSQMERDRFGSGSAIEMMSSAQISTNCVVPRKQIILNEDETMTSDYDLDRTCMDPAYFGHLQRECQHDSCPCDYASSYERIFIPSLSSSLDSISFDGCSRIRCPAGSRSKKVRAKNPRCDRVKVFRDELPEPCKNLSGNSYVRNFDERNTSVKETQNFEARALTSNRVSSSIELNEQQCTHMHRGMNSDEEESPVGLDNNKSYEQTQSAAYIEDRLAIKSEGVHLSESGTGNHLATSNRRIGDSPDDIPSKVETFTGHDIREKNDDSYAMKGEKLSPENTNSKLNDGFSIANGGNSNNAQTVTENAINQETTSRSDLTRQRKLSRSLRRSKPVDVGEYLPEKKSTTDCGEPEPQQAIESKVEEEGKIAKNFSASCESLLDKASFEHQISKTDQERVLLSLIVEFQSDERKRVPTRGLDYSQCDTIGDERFPCKLDRVDGFSSDICKVGCRERTKDDLIKEDRLYRENCDSYQTGYDMQSGAYGQTFPDQSQMFVGQTNEPYNSDLGRQFGTIFNTSSELYTGRSNVERDLNPKISSEVNSAKVDDLPTRGDIYQASSTLNKTKRSLSLDNLFQSKEMKYSLVENERAERRIDSTEFPDTINIRNLVDGGQVYSFPTGCTNESEQMATRGDKHQHCVALVFGDADQRMNQLHNTNFRGEDYHNLERRSLQTRRTRSASDLSRSTSSGSNERESSIGLSGERMLISRRNCHQGEAHAPASVPSTNEEYKLVSDLCEHETQSLAFLSEDEPVDRDDHVTKAVIRFREKTASGEQVEETRIEDIVQAADELHSYLCKSTQTSFNCNLCCAAMQNFRDEDHEDSEHTAKLAPRGRESDGSLNCCERKFDKQRGDIELEDDYIQNSTNKRDEITVPQNVEGSSDGGCEAVDLGGRTKTEPPSGIDFPHARELTHVHSGGHQKRTEMRRETETNSHPSRLLINESNSRSRQGHQIEHEKQQATQQQTTVFGSIAQSCLSLFQPNLQPGWHSTSMSAHTPAHGDQANQHASYLATTKSADSSNCLVHDNPKSQRHPDEPKQPDHERKESDTSFGSTMTGWFRLASGADNVQRNGTSSIRHQTYQSVCGQSSGSFSTSASGLTRFLLMGLGNPFGSESSHNSRARAQSSSEEVQSSGNSRAERNFPSRSERIETVQVEIAKDSNEKEGNQTQLNNQTETASSRVYSDRTDETDLTNQIGFDRNTKSSLIQDQRQRRESFRRSKMVQRPNEEALSEDGGLLTATERDAKQNGDNFECHSPAQDGHRKEVLRDEKSDRVVELRESSREKEDKEIGHKSGQTVSQAAQFGISENSSSRSCSNSGNVGNNRKKWLAVAVS